MNDGWKTKAFALALVILFVLECVLVGVAFWPGAPDEAVAFCFLVSPPCCLIVVIILGRLTLEFSWSESESNELEQLLQRKRGGALKLDARSYWVAVKTPAKIESSPKKMPVPPELAHHVQTAPSPTPTPANDVLDQLVNWKREHIGPSPQDEN